MAAEFYGLIDDNFEESEVPDGIWYTLSERRESGLPNHLIIVGSTGDGDLYCLETRERQKAEVIIYQPGIAESQQQHETVTDDFGTFLRNEVETQLANG